MAMALPEGDGRPEDGGGDGDGDGDGVDRISGLPEELLLQVLARLGCAREAAGTSVLARRWRGLSTRLPEYTFRDVEPESVEAALAQVTRPALDRLDIMAELNSEAALERAPSLLSAAPRLQPEKFSAFLWTGVEGAGAIELPCFDRASSLDRHLLGMAFTPPTAGEFTRLESLELSVGQEDILGALLPSCPRLRTLRIHYCRGLEVVTVHSATLQHLAVESAGMFIGIRHIDVDTPELREATLVVQMEQEFSILFSAPAAEKLDWTFTCIFRNVGFPKLRLGTLRYSLNQGVRTLRLDIDCKVGMLLDP